MLLKTKDVLKETGISRQMLYRYITAGLIREEKTYERATQSQYVTFRMISTGSPGWIRPATRGVHYAKEVARFAARIAPQAFQAFAESLR